MSPDNSKSNAEQQKTKKPDSKDDTNLSSKDADQVKGGFTPVPQPDIQSQKKVF